MKQIIEYFSKEKISSIDEYVKQASNFYFPRVINEYLSTKIVQSKIKATDETIHKIVLSEIKRLGNDADLNHIDVSEVTNMQHLFMCDTYGQFSPKTGLNPDISKWNMIKVENTRCMFLGCESFNGDLSDWDFENLEDIGAMFYGCKKFNSNLNNWNTGALRLMAQAFACCDLFNQPLNHWDVSNVEYMRQTFFNCKSFNQDISKWNVKKVKSCEEIFDGCPIKEEFKPKFKK